MPDYQIKVVERPAEKVVGLKVRTDMAKSAEDCPRLWYQDFGPRMPEVASFPSYSYGASLWIEGETFDYWAALPYRPGDPIPSGMALLDLTDGLYAECPVDKLEDLAGAYQHIFAVWGPSSGYDFAIGVPSYELYPADHMENGRLTLYMPLKKNSA